jgi:hypothetical protein
MIAGFGADIPRYLDEKPATPIVVHVHVAKLAGVDAQLTMEIRETGIDTGWKASSTANTYRSGVTPSRWLRTEH